MFERFSEASLDVIRDAQAEAHLLKHNFIGTEHILLGLAHGHGIASEVLGSFGVVLDELRDRVVEIISRGSEVTTGQIPFTPRAKKVLELSLREALSLGHNYIGTEHILLGLVREGGGVGVMILIELDLTAEKIRDETVRRMAGPGRRQRLKPQVITVPASSLADIKPVDVKPAVSGPYTFEPTFPDGSPRRYVGLYRPTLEMAEDEGRQRGHALAAVWGAWTNGVYDKPLYAVEEDEDQ